MRVIRALNPQVTVNLIRDKIVVETQEERDNALVQIEEMMTNYPTSTLALLAAEGEEIKCLLIAFAPERQNNAVVLQAWCDNKIEGTALQDSMFLKLCLWAQEQGKTIITAETTRDTEALHRRWGFTEYVRVVKFDLSGNFEEALIKTHQDLIKSKEVVEEPKNDSTEEKLSLGE